MTSLSGVGLGLRKPHIEAAALLEPGVVPFWEFAPENAMGLGGRMHGLTLDILTQNPAITHGITLSIGGFAPYDDDYLNELNGFLRTVETPFHSEHLCWSTHGGINTHDLLPLPFTRKCIHHTIGRIQELKARLEVPFLIENISYYAELGASEMSEKAFLADILEGADCGWLLDINNIYVNAQNFGFDPKEWLEGMPLERVQQMHIAGHLWDEEDQLIIDTHGEAVIDPVIELMQWVLPRIGRPIPVLLERDGNIPDLAVLLAEREKLQKAYDVALKLQRVGS